VISFCNANKTDKESQLALQLSDPSLGTLNYDSGLGGYRVLVAWRGAQVELTLEASAPNQAVAAIRHGLQLLSEQSTRAALLDEYAVNHLLELKNTTWLGEEELPLSATEFLTKLTLESFQVDSEGKFIFWFNDGGLFWGHTIQIDGSLSAGFYGVDILG
jgi:hypothetical protein